MILTKRFYWRFILIFTVMLICSTEFTYRFLPFVSELTSPFFEMLVRGTASIFGIDNSGYLEISSDTIGSYINMFNIIVISVVGTLIWNTLNKSNQINRLIYITRVIIAYYVALQLFVYGFIKVFKDQFYLPEPNLLFTPLGDLSHDILYWCSVGSSWTFCFITGVIEVILGFLLLFRKTRLLGGFLSIVVMIQIFVINISFNISVKLYSLSLVFLLLILISPYFKYLYHVLVTKRSVEYIKNTISFTSSKTKRIYFFAKTGIVLLMLTESLFYYVQSGNYNDDFTARPIFHGAYSVRGHSSENPNNWERVFVHRRGYFITQNLNDEMQDYQVRWDTVNKEIHLTRYDLNEDYILDYKAINNNLSRIQGTLEDVEVDIKLKTIGWQKMALINPEFHWTTTHE